MPQKRRISTLILIVFSFIVAALGVYMLYLYVNPSFDELFLDLFTGIRNQRLFYALFALLLAIYPLILFSRPKPVPERKTVTVVKCKGCDYREVRDFQKGDYVFKKMGSCSSCGSEKYVSAIYSVPVSRVEEKEEEF